jgi:hypothetical protein
MPAAPPSPLAQLNAHIAQAARAASEAAGEGESAMSGGVGVSQGPWPELRSAQRFRETWERLGAEVQVQQAQARAPLNAGPLNPQRLVLDILSHMGELSPHYLRRFLAHAETLLWLEQAQGQIKHGSASKGATAKPAKAARQKR